jgi:hypothetical protein
MFTRQYVIYTHWFWRFYLPVITLLPVCTTGTQTFLQFFEGFVDKNRNGLPRLLGQGSQATLLPRREIYPVRFHHEPPVHPD